MILYRRGFSGLGADLMKDPQSGGLQTPHRKPASGGSGSHIIGRVGSSHRSVLPPLTLHPDIVDGGGVPNPNPNVSDYQPFRKGAVLSPDVTRMDAGTGEGGYNPSDPMFKLQTAVRQAYVGLQRKYGGVLPSSVPTPATTTDAAVQAATQAMTTSGGGGGGGGDAPPDAPPSWWSTLSTPAKVGIVGGGAAAVGLAIYMLTKKRGGGFAPSSKSGLVG